MKTRKMWLGVLMLAGLLSPQFLRAQNVGINIYTPPDQTSIMNGEEGVLNVQVCNNDPAVSTPGNVVTPLVSFPTNLTIVGVRNLDGTPLSVADYEVMFISNIDAAGSHDVKVKIKKTLVPFEECAEYSIVVQGNAIGTGLVAGALFFEQPINNNTADDNSQTSMTVTINLPVTLKDFNAEKVEKTSVLTWHTTEETNSDRFEVQRSGNGKEWTTIETLQSAGESSETRSYEAIDRSPMNGENLYRLKMVDKDGTTAFSSVKSLKFGGIGMVVYPNPVEDFLHLDLADWTDVSRVAIYDVTGREVYASGKKPESKVDVRSLRSGVYNVRITKVSGSETSYRVAVVR